MNQCPSCNRLLLEESTSCPFCVATPKLRIPRPLVVVGLGASAFLMAACYGGGGMINSIDGYYYDDQDDDGFLTEDDCNDFDPSIHPMAVEICNGYDDNCNGLVDEAGIVYFNDFDQDGFGDPSDMIEACELPEGYIQDSSDCDDANPDIHPEAEEVCDDQVDNNCNNSIDLEDEACQ